MIKSKLTLLVSGILLSAIAYAATYHSGAAYYDVTAPIIVEGTGGNPHKIMAPSHAGSHEPEINEEFIAEISNDSNQSEFVLAEAHYDGTDIVIGDQLANTSCKNPWICDHKLVATSNLPPGLLSATGVVVKPMPHYTTSTNNGSKPCYIFAVVGSQNGVCYEANSDGDRLAYNSTRTKVFMHTESNTQGVPTYDYWQLGDDIETGTFGALDNHANLPTGSISPGIVVAQRFEHDTGACSIVLPAAVGGQDFSFTDWKVDGAAYLAMKADLQSIINDDKNNFLAAVILSDPLIDAISDLNEVSVYNATKLMVDNLRSTLVANPNGLQDSFVDVPLLFMEVSANNLTAGVKDDYNAELASFGVNNYNVGIAPTSTLTTINVSGKEYLTAESCKEAGDLLYDQALQEAITDSANLPPENPTNVTTGNYAATSFDVTWDGGEYSLRHYIYYQAGACPGGDINDVTGWTEYTTNGAGGAGSHTDTIQGLTATGGDAFYCVRIKSHNDFSSGSFGALAAESGTGKTIAATDVQEAPDAFTSIQIFPQTTVAHRGCSITWDSPDSYASPNDLTNSLWYCRDLDDCSVGGNWALWDADMGVCNTPSEDCSYEMADYANAHDVSGSGFIADDEDYYYYVKATNGFGTALPSSHPNPATNPELVGACTTTDWNEQLADWPNGDGNISIPGYGDTSVILQWDAPTTGSNASYSPTNEIKWTIEKCIDSEPNDVCDTGWDTTEVTADDSLDCQVNDTVCQYTVGNTTALTAQTNYRFRLTADNEIGGPPSEIINPTILSQETSGGVVPMTADNITVVYIREDLTTAGNVQAYVYSDDVLNPNVSPKAFTYSMEVCVANEDGAGIDTHVAGTSLAGCVGGALDNTKTVVSGGSGDMSSGAQETLITGNGLTGGNPGFIPDTFYLARLRFTNDGGTNSFVSDWRVIMPVSAVGSAHPTMDLVPERVFHWSMNNDDADMYCGANGSPSTITTTCASQKSGMLLDWDATPANFSNNYDAEIAVIETKQEDCYDGTTSLDDVCSSRSDYTGTARFVQDYLNTGGSNREHYLPPFYDKDNSQIDDGRLWFDGTNNRTVASEPWFNPSMLVLDHTGANTCHTGASYVNCKDTAGSPNRFVDAFFWMVKFEVINDDVQAMTLIQEEATAGQWGIRFWFDNDGDLCVGNWNNTLNSNCLSKPGGTKLVKGTYVATVRSTEHGGPDIRLTLWDIGDCVGCNGGTGADDIDPVILNIGGSAEWDTEIVNGLVYRSAADQNSEILLGVSRLNTWSGPDNGGFAAFEGYMYDIFMAKGAQGASGPYDTITNVEIKTMITQMHHSR